MGIRNVLMFHCLLLAFAGKGQSPEQLGKKALEERNYAQAEEQLRLAMEEHQQHGREHEYHEVRLLHSKALIHQGKIDEAYEGYQQCAAEGKANGWTEVHVQGLNAISTILEVRGQYKEMRRACEELIAIPNAPLEYVSDSYTLMGLAEMHDEKWSKAREHLFEALRLDSVGDNPRSLAYNHTNLGHIARKLAEDERAIQHYLKAIASLEQGGNQFILSTLCTTLGGLFLDLNDRRKARQYAVQARSLATEQHLPAALAQSRVLLGRLATAEDSLDLAINFFDAALEHQSKVKRTMGMVDIHVHKAQAYLKAGLDMEAERSLDQVSEILQENPIDYAPNAYYLAQADLSFLRSEPNEAGRWLDKLERSLTPYSRPHARLALHERRVEQYRATGRHDLALNALEQADMLKGSLYRTEQDRIVHELEAKYDEVNKEKEIAELGAANAMKEATLQKRDLQLMLIAGAALLALLITTAAIWQFRTVKRLNLKLADQNNVISKTLREKELLLKEIHHRVKNNLQVISSLLSLQSRQIKDDVALQAVNSSRNRVQSMALIHQNLYNEDNLTGVDLPDYVNKLSQSLLNSYRVDQRVDLVTDVDEIELDVDTTIPLGLILNELLTNALKYAFPEGRKGRISVRLKENGGILNLQVRDNGVGYDPSAIRGDESTSFGFNMIRSFSRKLKADWEVRNEDGTVVEMNIHKYKLAS